MASERSAELTRRLGRIAVGCATFGREISRDESFSVLDHAVANGVTHFDTAPAYGAGASERILGEWIWSRRPAPGSVLVATKVKPPYRPEAITTSVRASCERLWQEQVELLYLHQWSDELDRDGAIEELAAALPAAGVRALGASNFNAGQLQRMQDRLRAAGLPGIVALQNNHNFAVREVDAALLDVACRTGVAIVTYSPLGAGFLTGKHRGGVQPGSRFEVVPGHQNIYFTPEGWERLARLEALAARAGQPIPHAALGWVLRNPQINCTLVGGRSPAQLEQALAARALIATGAFDSFAND